MKLATLQSKEDVWKHAGVREDRYPVASNFRWITQDGTIMRVQDMHTSHLYNALRMLWNNTVPRAYVVPPFNHQYKINIPRPDRKAAVANLFNELMNRNNLTPGMKADLEQMARYVVLRQRKSIKR